MVNRFLTALFCFFLAHIYIYARDLAFDTRYKLVFIYIGAVLMITAIFTAVLLFKLLNVD